MLGPGPGRLRPGRRPRRGCGPLPHRVALVFGTESTGVSTELLAACDRRVYVPQHGFADSLNVGVAAALATSHVLKLVGGGGDLLEATDWSARRARLG